MTPAELDALEELEKLAVPAPWRNGNTAAAPYQDVQGPVRKSRDGATRSARFDGVVIAHARYDDYPNKREAKATMDLIAAMRNALPALIASARRELSYGDHTQRDQDSMVLHTAIVRADVAEDQLTAATARADALQAALEALYDAVDDNRNYIDDRHASLEVVVALKAAEAALSAARGK